MEIQQLPIIMKAEDVAEVLDISKHGAYALMKQKGFPCITVGRLKRVNREAFFKWMEEQNN
ncbi:MAG: helix-turn-helix domain-containing protein [Bacillus sp. (in: firmicutes)]